MRGNNNMDSDFLEFQKSLSRELITIKDRVRNLIGDAHWGEEGRYKESILKNVISRFLPNNLSVGTGFIITNERGRTKRSSQIDIIVYDNTYPLLFSDGDFIITTPENVKALIEVKTKIGTTDIIEIIRKSTKNAEIASQSQFNGIFSFKKGQMEISNNRINQNMKQALLESKGLVNHLCLGEHIFIKYWDQNKGSEFLGSYSFYEIEELAFSYFISNMLEKVAHEKVKDKSWFLYPIRDSYGKENYRINDLTIHNDVVFKEQ